MEVYITETDLATKFKGSPTVLRQILFYVADAIWPGWYENDKGQKVHLGYVKQAQSGTILLHNKDYWYKVKDVVIKQMQLAGIDIYLKLEEEDFAE